MPFRSRNEGASMRGGRATRTLAIRQLEMLRHGLEDLLAAAIAYAQEPTEANHCSLGSKQDSDSSFEEAKRPQERVETSVNRVSSEAGRTWTPPDGEPP